MKSMKSEDLSKDYKEIHGFKPQRWGFHDETDE